MNITSTAIAVSLAVVIGIAFLFFGPNVLRPFTPPAEAIKTDTGMLNMASTSDSSMQIPSELPTVLTVKDETVGTGAEAKAGATVTVDYTGMLPDGTVFDASERHGQPFSFTLGAGQVIPGWDQGLLGMKVGGKRQLIIPPDLAYGAQGAGGVIPPNTTLIFEVTLRNVSQ